MPRLKYKGIAFEPNYSRTFEQFRAEFENVWIFAQMPEKERLSELKKAFKIATTKNVSDIEVKGIEVVKAK
jgi:predicted HicB family RNase H-like nuclease